MERRAGADSSQVQVTSQAYGQGTHQVVDPADPPRDLSGWAWGVYVSLGLMAILGLVRLAAALDLRSAVTGGGDVVASYDAYSRWVGFHALLLLLAAGVFIAWFFQAYKNLRRLGVANMRYGNGWAIGAWFVPILSLWRPKQIANDVWRGSERGAEVRSGWRSVPVPGLVHWWWALFLAQGFVLYIGEQTVRSGYDDLSTLGQLGNGVSKIETGTTIDVVGEILAIAGVVLAIAFVSRITDRFAAIGGEALAQASLHPQQAQPQYPQPQYGQPQYAAEPQYPPPPPAPSYPPPPPPPPPPAQQLIQCPECAEWIQPQANLCRFCGYRLRPLGQ